MPSLSSVAGSRKSGRMSWVVVSVPPSSLFWTPAGNDSHRQYNLSPITWVVVSAVPRLAAHVCPTRAHSVRPSVRLLSCRFLRLHSPVDDLTTFVSAYATSSLFPSPYDLSFHSSSVAPIPRLTMPRHNRTFDHRLWSITRSSITSAIVAPRLMALL